MPTTAELRALSGRFRDASTMESDPHLKRFLVNHALALAQLAERIERAQNRNIQGRDPTEAD